MNKIIKFNQLFQLIIANFKEIIREPAVLFWGIVFPILMSVGLGVAFTKKADVVRKIAIIHPRSAAVSNADSTHIIESFLRKNAQVSEGYENERIGYKYTITNPKMGNTTFVFFKVAWRDAIVWLKQGYINIVMDEKNGRIRYNFDPSNPDAKLTYMQLTDLFGPKGNADIKNGDNIEPLTLHGTRYIDFLIPGLIAMGIMMSSMWGLSYSLIEKRAKKLLRRMVATPMKKSHFLIALITVRIGMNFIESFLLFAFALFVFDFGIQGSIPALVMVFVAGNIAFAGIAIFISSYTSKTEIGNGLINAVVMPMMILSGIFFSYHNFPDWSIALIQNLPLTLLADGMRSVFIEGGGFSEVGMPSMLLVVMGGVFFFVGLKIFKWH